MNDLTTLVSIFQDRELAGRASTDLQSAGVPQQSIQMLGGGSQTSAPEDSLNTLRSLDLPASDLQTLSAGLKSGGILLVVRTEESVALRAEEVLERYHNAEMNRPAAAAQTQARGVAAAGAEAVIPIVEESLVVGKRQVERGGVRVFSRIVQTPVQEQVVLREEHATIERHPVDRPISEADLAKLRDQTLEVREMGEEAVIAKTARVVEEINIGKDSTERTEQITDTLRKTKVDVEEIEADRLKKTR